MPPEFFNTAGIERILTDIALAIKAGQTPPSSAWQVLGRATLTSVSDSLVVSSITPRKHMMILLDAQPSGAITPWMRFNGDSGNNYAFRYAVNYGAGATIASTNGISLDTGAGASPTVASFYLTNTAAVEKTGVGQSASRGAAGAANLPSLLDVFGKWVGTDPITRVDVYNNTGAGDFAVGSSLLILGHD